MTNLSALLGWLLLVQSTLAFVPSLHSSKATTRTSTLSSAPADSDFARAVPATGPSLTRNGEIDPNVYNVELNQAAELWTVSVSAENQLERIANKPFLDVKSKDYYVDDVRVTLTRSLSNPGLGLELLELAGGRDDGVGLTIIEGVSGNAERAGVIAGDSLASVEYQVVTSGKESIMAQEIQASTLDCECRDFDSTFDMLVRIPPVDQVDSITLNLKRIRRWPKIKTIVEYPPSQVAAGVENTETLELFAGENLRRALLNRGIIMEDPMAPKCDFCGGKCTVKIDQGMPLLSPMSTTEEKIMRRNPKCRISCKTVVGYNMQEGNLRLRVNLNAWTDKDKKASNPFFSR